MYSDGTHLSSAMSYPNDINVELIPEFVKICDWLQTNKLSLNILKTEYMVIGTKHMLNQMGSIPKIKLVALILNSLTIDDISKIRKSYPKGDNDIKFSID